MKDKTDIRGFAQLVAKWSIELAETAYARKETMIQKYIKDLDIPRELAEVAIYYTYTDKEKFKEWLKISFTNII